MFRKLKKEKKKENIFISQHEILKNLCLIGYGSVEVTGMSIPSHMYHILCVMKTLKLRSLCDFDEYSALLPTVAAFLYSRPLEHCLQMEELKFHLPSSSSATKPQDQGAIIAFPVSVDSVFLDSAWTWAPVVSVFLCCLSSFNKDVPPGSPVLSQRLTCIPPCTRATLLLSSLQLMDTEVGPTVGYMWRSLSYHFSLFSSSGYVLLEERL